VAGLTVGMEMSRAQPAGVWVAQALGTQLEEACDRGHGSSKWP
jgi:hypothetical protein